MGLSTLTVRQPNGATLTFGPKPQHDLIVQAHELVAAGLGDAEFRLDGELLLRASVTTQECDGLDEEHDEEPEAIDAEYLEADLTGTRHTTANEPPAPAMQPQEAGAIAQSLLRNATKIHNDLLDAAARRSAEMTANIAALEDAAVRRSAEITANMAAQEAAQAQHQLAAAKELQDFVGAMNATLAQERLAAFQIKGAEVQLAEQAAAKEYAKQLALAEANKPSPGMIIAELAVSFAANLARNSAANFNEMNPKD